MKRKLNNDSPAQSNSRRNSFFSCKETSDSCEEKSDAVSNSVNYDLVKPFFEGESLNNIKNFKEYLICTKKAAEELQSLHQRDIIHGDVHGKNILVQKLEDGTNKIQLVGFNFACGSSTEMTINNKPESFLYWPPERRQENTSIKANCNQDVYSFLFMLHDKLTTDFPDKAPSLLEVVNFGMESKPGMRPSLDDIIEKLSYEICMYDDFPYLPDGFEPPKKTWRGGPSA